MTQVAYAKDTLIILCTILRGNFSCRNFKIFAFLDSTSAVFCAFKTTSSFPIVGVLAFNGGRGEEGDDSLVILAGCRFFGDGDLLVVWLLVVLLELG
jgi:hypothetical protein